MSPVLLLIGTKEVFMKSEAGGQTPQNSGGGGGWRGSQDLTIGGLQ